MVDFDLHMNTVNLPTNEDDEDPSPGAIGAVFDTFDKFRAFPISFPATNSTTNITKYDISVASHGTSTSPPTINYKYRTVTIDADNFSATPLLISPFLDNLSATLVDMVVVPRFDIGDLVKYDIFLAYTSSGTNDYEITVVTSPNPPGDYSTAPTTANAPEFEQTIQRTVGGVRVYDHFVVSERT
jgi:hypothetical protein